MGNIEKNEALWEELIKLTVITQLSDLKENPDNPRKITPEKLELLKKKITDNPHMLAQRPILHSKGTVLGGNQRLKALLAMGYTKAPAADISSWPKAKQKSAILLDNAAFGEWLWDVLDGNWTVEELKDHGIDPPNDRFKNEDGEEDDYDIPDELETDIVLGDLIEIGPHRLICGDSTDSDVLTKLMDGKLADMIHTDPPYNVDYGASKNPRHKIREIKNDSMDTNAWEDFCKAIYSNFQLFNKGDIYMWGGSGPEGMRMRLWLVEAGAHWSATIIWKKDQLVLSPAKYQRLYEPCFYGWFGKSTFRADRKQTEVWDIERPKRSKEHPTMKPIKLCVQAINNSSKERDIVLDLFLGSGSTMVAAAQINRVCYGVELEPHYCEVIIDRMTKNFPDLKVKINGKERKQKK